MEWIERIGDAIKFIEDNMTEDITIKDIAENIFISPFYFQKGFSMLCGFTVGEYIKKRRLTLAGIELLSTDNKIIDIALKYGYDSPDSFTKAFTRFHGVTPTAVRKDGAVIKSFAPLKIKFTLEGGCIMDYRIVEKEAFTVMGSVKRLKNEDGYVEVPKFWKDHYAAGKNDTVCGTYGISIDESMSSNEFDYMIADEFKPGDEVAEGYVTKVIPKHTWAVFSCKGPLPKALQYVNTKIFSEWIPNCRNYEIAAGYFVEMYTDVNDYPKGGQDENNYSEIWIPVKKK